MVPKPSAAQTTFSHVSARARALLTASALTGSKALSVTTSVARAMAMGRSASLSGRTPAAKGMPRRWSSR